MNRWLNPTLALACLIAFALSLSLGPAPVGLLTFLRPLSAEAQTAAAVIFIEIRLPRAILALAIGATLGLSGAALQGLLRNPLAEPALLGVSGFAALGAVIAFYTGWAIAFPLALPLGGMGGALLAVLALVGLAGRESSPTTLILAGVALNAVAGAATTLALSLSPNPFALAEIVFWLLGSVADRSLTHVVLALPPMILGAALLLASRRGLDALTLGEDTARSLGVPLGRLRLQVVIGTALAVGPGVAVAGAIGFVGLIVPHLLRPLVGHSPARLLPASALAGAALLGLADAALRMPAGVQELKLGVATAILGAPFFLWLVLASRRRLA